MKEYFSYFFNFAHRDIHSGKNKLHQSGMILCKQQINNTVMIKHIFGATIVIFLLASCQSHNVEIKGTIKEADKQKVYLEQLNVDKTVVSDSAKTNRKGEFSFKINVTEPTFYNIRVGQKEHITLLAEPDKKIELSGTYNNLSNNYWVEGSEGSQWIKLLNFQLNRTQRALDSLRKIYEALPDEKANLAQRTAIAAEWDSVFMKQFRFSKDFIIKHAVSPASYYALYQTIGKDNFILTPENDLQSYKIVASSMMAMYPESQYTKALLAHYEQIKKNIQAMKMRELIVNSENDLPAIDLPDINGTNISLKSLKGKFIILDFIVLGTPESQAHINELKTIYNKYRNKGVEIYQVCLDQNQLLWEEYVRLYDIKWKCVRDPQALKSYVASIWNVQSIPANYIIDPKFDIVGKNLYGQRLSDRLQDVLK